VQFRSKRSVVNTRAIIAGILATKLAAGPVMAQEGSTVPAPAPAPASTPAPASSGGTGGASGGGSGAGGASGVVF
jgi:hypothetical protein